MWFAALGSYNNNPWLIHLIYKMLQGSGDSIDLLDTESYPFKESPPEVVKATLYHYDFTRLANPTDDVTPT